MKKYAHIIIENRASQTDRPYTYIIGEEFLDLLEVGMRVVVPFGRGNRPIKGLVIDIGEQYDGSYRLKYILDVIDERPLIEKDLIHLSMWMSDYYLSPYLDAFKTVLPPGDFKKLRTDLYLKEDRDKTIDLDPREERIIEIISQGEGDLEKIKKTLKDRGINKTVREMEDRGLIRSKLVIETSVNKQYESYVELKEGLDDPRSLVGSRAFKQVAIVNYLLEAKGEVRLEEVLKKVETGLSTVKALEEKDILVIRKKEIYREAVKKEIPYYKKHSLNHEQKLAVERILTGDHRDYLVHGVTGSGKTEVYLQVVEEVLKRGEDSIILVPEISLTPQTIDRFVGRFGDRVAVLHSRLSFGERFDQWRKIRDGEVKIVVGARSAIFAPFRKLGLVVVDEEHETSYKSSMNPKYDALEVARKRVDMVGGKLVRGSATPSLETYFQAKEGLIGLIDLRERANRKPLPDLEIVDMREELSQGNRTMFSRNLYQALKLNLDRGQQTILFLNRRGHSTFVSCRECGYVVKCNECDVSLTYHKSKDLCKCHYCGLALRAPKICPECSSKYIRYFGTGTEQVEDFTRKLFPEARIDRMDLDTVSKKGSYDIKLDRMKSGETDILIGTQMIAKGLDFSNVTLVGIITADTSLNLPDFRSSEKTFQLITQVAGRSGRGQLEGRVIVQTYTPEHYSIEHSKTHDYRGFYEEEILLRQAFNYPPFIEIFSLVIYGENLRRVEEVALTLKNILEDRIFEEDIAVELIGPYPSPLDKIKNNFRYHILFKVGKEDQRKLKSIINRVCIDNKYNINLKGIRYNIDVGPTSIL